MTEASEESDRKVTKSVPKTKKVIELLLPHSFCGTLKLWEENDTLRGVLRGTSKNLWNPLKSSENLWKPLRTSENLSETLSETLSEADLPLRTSQACCPYLCCPFIFLLTRVKHPRCQQCHLQNLQPIKIVVTQTVFLVPNKFKNDFVGQFSNCPTKKLIPIRISGVFFTPQTVDPHNVIQNYPT